jgi:hypothetical protein
VDFPGMKQEESTLNVAALRLTGNDALLDDIVRKLGLKVASRSKAGSPRRRAGTYAASTLNALIADAASPAAMLGQVRAFLAQCRGQGSSLFVSGIDAELSIGISVGDSGQFAASVNLSSAEIRELADLGLSLKFTAYPRSDEDPATQSQPTDKGSD